LFDGREALLFVASSSGPDTIMEYRGAAVEFDYCPTRLDCNIASYCVDRLGLSQMYDWYLV